MPMVFSRNKSKVKTKPSLVLMKLEVISRSFFSQNFLVLFPKFFCIIIKYITFCFMG